MKRLFAIAALLIFLVPAGAQTVIYYRRPMNFLTVEGGMSLSTITGFNNRAEGSWHPYFNVGMDLPLMQNVNMRLMVGYRNKSFTGVPTDDNPTAPPSHEIHAVELGLLYFDWYPFGQGPYLGAGLDFGGNILVRRLEADGTKTLIKSENLDALGLTMSYSLEAGYSFSFWPIGDRVAIFGRFSQDFFGAPFNKDYCSNNHLSRKMRCANISAGLRIPIIMMRD